MPPWSEYYVANECTHGVWEAHPQVHVLIGPPLKISLSPSSPVLYPACHTQFWLSAIWSVVSLPCEYSNAFQVNTYTHSQVPTQQFVACTILEMVLVKTSHCIQVDDHIKIVINTKVKLKSAG